MYSIEFLVKVKDGVRLWRFQWAGGFISQLEDSFIPHDPEKVRSYSFSSDGRWVAIGRESQTVSQVVEVYDTKTSSSVFFDFPSEAFEAHHDSLFHYFGDVQFIRGSKADLLISWVDQTIMGFSGSWEMIGAIEIYNIQNKMLLCSERQTFLSSYDGMMPVCSTNGNAFALFDDSKYAHALKIFDIPSFECKISLTGYRVVEDENFKPYVCNACEHGHAHCDVEQTVRLKPDGSALVSTLENWEDIDTLLVIDHSGINRLDDSLFGSGSPVGNKTPGFRFTNDGKTLVAVGRDHTLCFICTETWKITRRLPISCFPENLIDSHFILTDDQKYACLFIGDRSKHYFKPLIPKKFFLIDLKTGNIVSSQVIENPDGLLLEAYANVHHSNDI